MTQTLKEYAKERAGYAVVDTPCEPRRSAYTNDSQGLGAWLLAEKKWAIYSAIMDEGTNS